MASFSYYFGGGGTGRFILKGTLDASASPNYPSAIAGDAYQVTVSGKVGGSAGVPVEVGDLVYATADNAGGTQASVGSSWGVMQGNENLFPRVVLSSQW